ncbi:Cytochrome P450 71A1 like [Quillaja saponaria]|uniref:Cytochrome P450 71A1 like n=1 Tax=Quillaja saponaria TaxID=32244 RepID=A0AAD7PSB4_QUISA|nr:Cytochrome P450 71A1 like [Quillaja saponaria]
MNNILLLLLLPQSLLLDWCLLHRNPILFSDSFTPNFVPQEFSSLSLGKSEKKQNKNVKAKTFANNGVVITIYVESTKAQSQQLSDPIKKTKPHPHPKRLRATKTQVYDRRARLLNYYHQLRNAGTQEVPQVQLPRNHSRPKTKRCIWLNLPSIRMLRRSSSRWRYENTGFERESNKEEKEQGTRKQFSHFYQTKEHAERNVMQTNEMVMKITMVNTTGEWWTKTKSSYLPKFLLNIPVSNHTLNASE